MLLVIRFTLVCEVDFDWILVTVDNCMVLCAHFSTHLNHNLEPCDARICDRKKTEKRSIWYWCCWWCWCWHCCCNWCADVIFNLLQSSLLICLYILLHFNLIVKNLTRFKDIIKNYCTALNATHEYEHSSICATEIEWKNCIVNHGGIAKRIYWTERTVDCLIECKTYTPNGHFSFGSPVLVLRWTT